ncbi:hypothetical protein FLAG1_08393 [Fusarium langsethiae]|uniref:Uncharacterized protein n=1 Tax=Fusarium langsethiae TaxID=179993 RepID=A0A0M9ES47_FUSLA|nr:hypothetical protein FLAG1_08393 [Fusarium langsethiae]
MEFQPFEQLLKTKPHKFVVGPNRVEYYVQPTLFYHSSTPLENLIHETEATNGSVTWTDVDEHVFWGRKAEDDTSKLSYSLTTYSAAVELCSPVCSPDPSPQRSSKRKFDTMACDSESLCHYPKRKEYFIQQFMTRYDVSADVGSIFSVQQDSQLTDSANEAILRDFAFIGHAKMFLLAHRYGITSLVKHACTNLAQELSHWEISVSTFVSVFGGLVDCR